LASLRSRIATALSLSAIAGALLLGPTASPAAAASCVTTYGYASVTGDTTVVIWCGNIERGSVEVLDKGTYYTIIVSDYYCDNIGPYWHAWKTDGTQYKYGTSGCGNSSSYFVDKSLIGSPKNWWAEWGGTNSKALAFP
jgi:hypothetical protein